MIASLSDRQEAEELRKGIDDLEAIAKKEGLCPQCTLKLVCTVLGDIIGFIGAQLQTDKDPETVNKEISLALRTVATAARSIAYGSIRRRGKKGE